MDTLAIVGRIGGDNPPTDSELSHSLSELRSALDAATSGDNPDLAVARDLRGAIDRVTSEQAARAEAAEAARAEAAALREGLFDDSVETTEDTAEEDEADTPVEQVEATAEPVAASFSAMIERLRARTADAASRDEVVPAGPGVEIRSVGSAAGYALDQNSGFSQVGGLFSTHAKSVTASGASTPLVRLTRYFSEERTLGSNVDLNNRKISDVLGPDMRPVTASGGFCGPGDVDHSHPIFADRGRPVRDSMIQFNASRGRVTFAPAAGLGDLEGAVSVWTADTDANPGSTVKPCPPVECPEEISCSVDAVTRCLTVGNFQAQFSPEFWASRLELLMAAHDREAEQKLIDEIHAASTKVTGTNMGNVLGSFLTSINSVVSRDRAIHRNTSGRYTVIADAWLLDAIRNQIVANLGVANNVDVLQIADSQIASWLSVLNADVVWTPDGTMDETSGDRNLPADATETPAQTTVYVHPSDAFLFLDGGTLDLGTSITDSSLNATNDRQAFAETFEKGCFRGVSAYAVEIDTSTACGCPSVAGGGEG